MCALTVQPIKKPLLFESEKQGAWSTRASQTPITTHPAQHEIAMAVKQACLGWEDDLDKVVLTFETLSTPEAEAHTAADESGSHTVFVGRSSFWSAGIINSLDFSVSR